MLWACRSAAEEARRTFEARGHHQHHWIVERMAAVSVRPAEEHEREWLRETLAGRVRARPPLLRLREEDAPHLTLNALVPGRGARRR